MGIRFLSPVIEFDTPKDFVDFVVEELENTWGDADHHTLAETEDLLKKKLLDRAVARENKREEAEKK
jgi:hypothetical protein